MHLRYLQTSDSGSASESESGFESESEINGPIIELRQLGRVYGQGDAAVHALRGVDLQIHAGEFVSLMGPSGSGKSTCMNILG